MKSEAMEGLKKIVMEAEVVYVETADRDGFPHIAAAEGMAFLEENQILFRAWFCLKTLENLENNPRVSLAVLSPRTKQGYQILGKVEKMEEGAILDGYGPGEERRRAVYPQAERQLLIRIERLSSLTSGPHSDEFI